MALRAVPDHPKFARLKATLNQPRGAVLGWLESVWHFAGRFTPHGDIGKYTDAEIESWVEWSGKPGELIAALLQSGWLDADPQHRILVHDWSQHADKATKQAVQRSKKPFCAPGVCTPFPLSGTPYTQSDEVEHAETETGAVCPLPVPVPVPEPVPGAGAGPTAPPSPAPLPLSPGANGEFLAATALLQDCEIPSTSADIRIMAQLVQIEAKHHGGIEGAVHYLTRQVTEARARGEPVTVFWLKDRKYLQSGGNGNGASNPSPSTQRINGARRVLAEIAIKRGLYRAPGDVGQPDEAIPERGPSGEHGGLREGLRSAGSGARPAQSHGGSGTPAHPSGPEILPPA